MSNVIICRNCGLSFSGECCPQCGYGVNMDNVFKNEIKNKELKEDIADVAISILANSKLISLDKDLKHLVIEFGYLLVPEHSDKAAALLKVMPPKRMFQAQRTYYLGLQEGKFHLLNENFNEKMFKKISNDMMLMHRIDLNSVNKNDYTVELY